MFDAYQYEAIESLKTKEISFPLYRSNMRGELYMLQSRTRAVSLRYDDIVKGIGISDNMTIEHFARMYSSDPATKENFDSLYHKLKSEIENF